MKHYIVAILIASFLSACATTESVPLTRKLSSNVVESTGDIPVVIERVSGVDVAWASASPPQAIYTDYSMMVPHVSPAAAGIGGVLGQALATAVMDAAPSARAKRLLTAINQDIDNTALNEAMMEKIIAANGVNNVELTYGKIQDFDRKTPEPDNALKVHTTYTLAIDASAILVKAIVTYNNDDFTYVSPHTFENKIPKSEQTGPLYRNRFSFYSDQLPIPEVSDTIRATLKSIINVEHAEDMAALSSGISNERDIRKLVLTRDRRLKAAEDDKLSKNEVGLLLIGEWQKNDSALLHATLDESQNYLADMIALDIQDKSIPQFERRAKRPKVKDITDPLDAIGSPLFMQEYRVLDTAVDGRQNLMITSGFNSGAYVSMPASGFSFFGNARKSVK